MNFQNLLKPAFLTAIGTIIFIIGEAELLPFPPEITKIGAILAVASSIWYISHQA